VEDGKKWEKYSACPHLLQLDDGSLQVGGQPGGKVGGFLGVDAVSRALAAVREARQDAAGQEGGASVATC